MKNTVNNILSTDDSLAELLGKDFQVASSSQNEKDAMGDYSTEALQELTSEDIRSVLPAYSNLNSELSQIDDDFIDLDPPTPAAGTRNLIKIVNIRQDTNQLTNFGVKTVTSIDIGLLLGR